MTSPCLPGIVPFTCILYEWVHIVFISWCCWSKIPHTGWLTTTEVTSLKSLEVKSLRSRCYRASLPWKALKMDLSLTFPRMATQLQSWLHVSMDFLFCVSLYGLLLIRMPAIGFRGYLNPVWPHHNSITSAKTLKSHSHVLQYLSVGDTTEHRGLGKICMLCMDIHILEKFL